MHGHGLDVRHPVLSLSNRLILPKDAANQQTKQFVKHAVAMVTNRIVTKVEIRNMVMVLAWILQAV